MPREFYDESEPSCVCYSVRSLNNHLMRMLLLARRKRHFRLIVPAILLLILIDQSFSVSVRGYIKQHYGSVSNIPQGNDSLSSSTDSKNQRDDENYAQTEGFRLTPSRKRKVPEPDKNQHQHRKFGQGSAFERMKRRKGTSSSLEREKNRAQRSNESNEKPKRARKFNEYYHKQRLALTSPNEKERLEAEAYFKHRRETKRKRYAIVTERIQTKVATKQEIEGRRRAAQQYKNFASNNRSKMRKDRREYYQKHKDKILARNSEYYIKHKEKVLAQTKARRDKKKELELNNDSPSSSTR